ncbi:hypothetical protein N9S81_00385 [bacterium]|nr:hypothetical protein [bacterium]
MNNCDLQFCSIVAGHIEMHMPLRATLMLLRFPLLQASEERNTTAQGAGIRV